MKTTYVDSVNKIAVRNFLLQLFSFDKVVGLGGPDINVYISTLMKRGYKHFELYESDRDVFLKQVLTINPKGSVSLIYGDVYNALLQPNTLYDLDFCQTIKSLKQYVIKFDKNFIMTFSARYSLGNTIDDFFSLRNERITRIRDNKKWKIIITDASSYVFISYRDTSPMCCIANSQLFNYY